MIDPDPGSVGSRTFWSNRVLNNLSGSGSVSDLFYMINLYSSAILDKSNNKDSHTRLREREWDSPNSDERTGTVVL